VEGRHPIHANHVPVINSLPHDAHTVTGVHNDACPAGPNPFAGVLAPLDNHWAAAAPVMLLPLDAEFDPAAVERLRYGASAPLEV
jgi:hypothetical protein